MASVIAPSILSPSNRSSIYPPSPVGSNASASSSRSSLDDDGEFCRVFDQSVASDNSTPRKRDYNRQQDFAIQEEGKESTVGHVVRVPPSPLLSINAQGPSLLDHLYPHHRALIQYIRHPNTYIWFVTTRFLPFQSFTYRNTEIQELRHKSQSSGDASGTTGIIDQALMSLDGKLENVTKGMITVNESLEPLLQSVPTPTPMQNGDSSEHTLLLRKHATLVSEWESVQDESDVLREELKEDKWLTVFRTVTEQADGMMSSLEKAVNRCQVSGRLQKFPWY